MSDITTLRKKAEAIQTALNDLILEIELLEIEQVAKDNNLKPAVVDAPPPPKSLVGLSSFLATSAETIDLPGARKMAGVEKPMPANIGYALGQVPPKATSELDVALGRVPSEPVEESIVLSPEQKEVIDRVVNGTEHFFITGNAGTGKSVVLTELVKRLSWGSTVTLAPTGKAAVHVNGMTIHSFFGLKPEALSPDKIHELPDDSKDKFKSLRMIIIDEISMVRADLMDAIDVFMRKNGNDASRPFGGCRMIMIGDLFQLAPVSSEDEVKHWLEDRYGINTPYFFHAAVWRETPLITCELKTIFRQKDPVFTNTLNLIRNGKANNADLNLINHRTNAAFKPPSNEVWVTLTTTNSAADVANQTMMDELPGEPTIFKADVIGDFKLSDSPTDAELKLKVGAVVMFIKNNRAAGYINGTMGRITSVKPLKVEITNEEGESQFEVEVSKATWDQITYDYDRKERKIVKHVKGQFIQIPLKLAAAITIHKAQGLSLSRVIVDLGHKAFAAGQTYVAISRARTLAGLVLRRPVYMKDLIISPEVQAFLAGRPIAQPRPVSDQLMLEIPDSPAKPAEKIDAA